MIEKVTGHSYYDYVQQHIYAPAGMTQRFAARRPSGPRPVDRIHQATRNDRVEPEHRHAALPRNLRRRRLLDRRGPRTLRPRAPQPQTAQPRLHQAADHRKGQRRARRQIRLRLRRRPRRRRQRLGRPRRRRTRHKRRPEDLPQIRLRGRGAGEPRPARSTTRLRVPRPPTADKAIAPRAHTRRGSRPRVARHTQRSRASSPLGVPPASRRPPIGRPVAVAPDGTGERRPRGALVCGRQPSHPRG